VAITDESEDFILEDESGSSEDLHLEFQEEFPGCLLVYLVDGQTPGSRSRLCRLDERSDLLSIYPLVTWRGKPGFLGPKYQTLRAIELEGFGYQTFRSPESIVDVFLQLPAGFVKSHEYGLGLKKEFAAIINTLEAAGISTLVISKRTDAAKIEEGIYLMPASRYDTLRKALNRITAKYRSEAVLDRRVLAQSDLLTSIDAQAYPEMSRPYKKDTIFKIVHDTLASKDAMSEADKAALISATRSSTGALAKTQTDQLLALKADIELATLAELIEKFDDMIAGNLSESRWQTFFQQNPFVLSLAFGYPIVMLQGQASIGGTRLNGGGVKIADFLVQAQGTGNAAIVEIKGPGSAILQKRPYRPGLYAPSTELSGALSQCLDQVHQLQRDISRLKDESDLPDLQAHAVHCVLVAGTLPTERSAKKSFELLRNSLHGVTVITFDELRGKLQIILTLLQSEPVP